MLIEASSCIGGFIAASVDIESSVGYLSSYFLSFRLDAADAASKRQTRAVLSPKTDIAYRALAANARRHAMHAPPCNTPTLTRHTSTNIDPIEAAIAAIKSQDVGEQLVY